MNKPKIFTSMFLLLLIASLSLAQTVTETQFETQTTSSGLEIARNWQLLSIIALVASVILVAIAYAVGIGFEMPEIKAWAGNELVQIVANAVIIGSLIVTIAFIDGLVIGIVTSSGINIPECFVPGESCLQAVTNAYLTDYVETAKTNSKNILLNNIQQAAAANRRYGVYCLTIYCIQLGFTTTLRGEYLLDQDMNAILFEYNGNLLSSMEAQRFFVDEISFKMGPLILAIGIVARSFFFTRKLGGLLIAVAAGIMFFLPGMYIFDWVTLDMALTGDKALDSEPSTCPAECSLQIPLAIYDGGKLYSPTEVYDAFSVADADKAEGIISGSIESAVGSNDSSPANGEAITSCYAGEAADCPQACRELPYPFATPICAGNQSACAEVPEDCKVKRLVTAPPPPEESRCPDSCKIVPPLRSNCDVDDCLESRYDCRIAKRTDLEWRPTLSEAIEDDFGCSLASDCPANLTASQSCVYVIPDTGNCNDLCVDCPVPCRIVGADLDHLPAICKNDDGELKETCEQCIASYDSCTVRLEDIENIELPAGVCTVGGETCWDERRIITSADLPSAYKTGACSLEECPKDYRIVIPRNTCETCLFTEEAYTYDPPIQTRCGDLCAPSSNVPTKSAGEYTKIGSDGLVGKEEIKNVSKLMVPIYLLPLFNIVATLVFIKGLSALLGGDIEIPGLAKVF